MGLSPMGNEGGFGLVGWSNDLVGMREVEDVEERDIVFVFVCLLQNDFVVFECFFYFMMFLNGHALREGGVNWRGYEKL